MEQKFDVTPMPAYWASYLINGDASGLEVGEKDIVDKYLEANDIIEVIDAPEEAYFSWSFDMYGGSCSGGELLDYTVIFNIEPVSFSLNDLEPKQI